MPFLAARALAAEMPVARSSSRWLADLDCDQYETRQTATMELGRLGCLMEKRMEKALTSGCPLEVQGRLQELLDKLPAVCRCPRSCNNCVRFTRWS